MSRTRLGRPRPDDHVFGQTVLFAQTHRLDVASWGDRIHANVPDTGHHAPEHEGSVCVRSGLRSGPVYRKQVTRTQPDAILARVASPLALNLQVSGKLNAG